MLNSLRKNKPCDQGLESDISLHKWSAKPPGCNKRHVCDSRNDRSCSFMGGIINSFIVKSALVWVPNTVVLLIITKYISCSFNAFILYSSIATGSEFVLKLKACFYFSFLEHITAIFTRKLHISH